MIAGACLDRTSRAGDRAGSANLRVCLLRGPGVALAAVLFAAGGASATVRDWDRGGGSYDWYDGNNWNPNGVPDASDSARINTLCSQASSVTINGGYAYSTTLYLGEATGQAGYVRMVSGTYYAYGNMYVGDSGVGVFTQDGGTVANNDSHYRNLYIGYDSNGVGTYALNAGDLYTKDQYVGRYGQGTFLHSGGTNNIGAIDDNHDLYIGYASSTKHGSGTYRLSNTGQINLYDDNGQMFVGNTVSSTVAYGRFEWFRSGGICRTPGGTQPLMVVDQFGTLAMGYSFDADLLMDGNYVWLSGLNAATLEITNGATATKNKKTICGVTYLRVGSWTGPGTANLIDGNVVTGQDEYVGDWGTGNFNQSGGYNNVTTHFYVGTSGGDGNYVLTGGYLIVGSHEHVGDGGTGKVYQTGGSNVFSGSTLFVGQGSGSGLYRLDGTGTMSGSAIRIGADGAAGRFEWFRSDGLTLSSMTLGSLGTLAMGFDFDANRLASGALFGGTMTGLNLGTLEVTRSAKATHNSRANTYGNLKVGSSTGAGTYSLGGTGQITIGSGGSIRVGADGNTGRFEWYRSGGLSTPSFVLGSAGTLAMGADFDANLLGSGALFGGTMTGLNLGTLEVTNGATATHNSRANTYGNLKVGTGAGAGTYSLGGTGQITISSGGSIRVGADGSAGRFEWFRSGGLSTPIFVLGNLATLAMGYDFDANRLASGGYVPISGLGSAQLEVTNGATATHLVAGVSVAGLAVGSATGTGTYALGGSGGLTAPTETIGQTSTGRFVQTGGTNTVSGTLTLGAGGAGVDGTYEMNGGTVTGAGSMMIRAADLTSGTLRGRGSVLLTGRLTNNGRVEANGLGTDGDLSLPNFAQVDNTIENPAVGGTHGWYASNHGRLILPPVPVTAGSHTYNWGESPFVPGSGGPIQPGAGDTYIDLVNSVQVAFKNISADGYLGISLLATDHGEAPEIPEDWQIIGLWQADANGFTFDKARLTFRYDDALADSLRIDQNDLRVFQVEGGTWTDVTDRVDTAGKWIFSTDVDSFCDFAVGVPEPASLGLLVMGGMGMLARRRRTHQR